MQSIVRKYKATDEIRIRTAEPFPHMFSRILY